MRNNITQEIEDLKIVHVDQYMEVHFNSELFDQLNRGLPVSNQKAWLIFEYCKNEFIHLESAQLISNGFRMKASDVLDKNFDEVSDLFSFPEPLSGSIEIKATGLNAASENYKIRVKYTENGSRVALPFFTAGCLLKGRSKTYSLNKNQEKAFRYYKAYESALRLTENDHYHIVAAFKAIDNDKLKVQENRFKTLNIDQVEKVGLKITKQESGDLLLEPNLKGFNFEDEDALRREFSFIEDPKPSTLHLGRNLIQIDSDVSDAVLEIKENSTISKDEVEDFFNNPGSYIDANKVDIDEGFSYRVQGISEFTLVEFGDYDGQDNDWFVSDGSFPIENFEAYIKSEEELNEFVNKAINAFEVNSKRILFNKNEFLLPSVKEFEVRVKKKREELIEEQAQRDNDNYEVKRNIGFDLKYFEENKSIAEQYKVHELDDKVFHGLKFQPFEHQRIAIEWIFSLYRCSLKNTVIRGGILADDMGLGKTFSSLVGLKAICEYEKMVNGSLNKSFLVVAPLSLLNNWREEVSKFFDKSPFTDVVVLNSKADLNRFRLTKGSGNKQFVKEGISFENSKIRYALKIGEDFGTNRLDIPGRLMLITYETMRTYQFSMAKIPFYAVIFDEAQKIKNPNSLATRAAKALNSDINILATGTPVENNLEEYWCLMDTANPTLLGSRKEFKDTYIRPTKESEDEAIKIEIGKKLYENSGPFLLRRTKEELKGKLGGNLPDKVEYKGLEHQDFKYLDILDKRMTQEQVDKYDEIRKNYVETRSALKNLHRLKSCMLHPRLTFTNSLSHMTNITSDEFWNESAKLQSLFEIIKEIKAREEKLLIFVISRNMQYLIKKWINVDFGLNPDIISGETKVESFDYQETRLGMIDKFSKKEGSNIIILSPLAAGVGLNVTAANHVFHLERHWNPAKEAQANDRAYRIGQDKEVSIYYPISKHNVYESFDIKLDNLLNRKTFTKDVLMTYPRMSEQEFAEKMWD